MFVRLTLVGLTIACSGDDTIDSDEVSYTNDVAPLLARRCNDCHHPGTAGDYDFTAPFDPETGLVDRANSWVVKGAEETVLVEPGNPDNSFLLVKVDGSLFDPETDGGFMPLHRPRMSTSELASIETWILDGAQDDDQFRDEVAPLLGTRITLGADGGRCTDCHYPGAPNGLSVLDVFDPVEGLVDRDARGGGLLVAPGDPDGSVLMERLTTDVEPLAMPLHPTPLTADEIDVFRRWIEQGASDDSP